MFESYSYQYFHLRFYQFVISLFQVAQRVFFLHEELTKLPSFPRKALEADFNLYKGGAMGKVRRVLLINYIYTYSQYLCSYTDPQLSLSLSVALYHILPVTDLHIFILCNNPQEVRGLDQLHKYMWVQLVTRMFEGMAGNLTYTTDIHLFLNVINGALLLHCEDSSMLRLCMASYVNAAHHFKNLFSTSG